MLDDYLLSSGMPGLTPTALQELEILITLDEVKVNSAKVGKAPGPDGFTAQYY